MKIIYAILTFFGWMFGRASNALHRLVPNKSKRSKK